MNRKFKLLPVAALMSAVWAAQAQQLAYAPEMLRALASPNQNVDFSYFEKGFDLIPGVYRFSLKVNGSYSRNENFELKEINGKLEPIFLVKDILSLPLKDEILLKFKELDPKAPVFPLSSKLKDVITSIDSEKMEIEVSIPQIYLADSQGWVDVVDPSLWESGETAAVVNYNLTGNLSKSRQSSVESKNVFLNLSGRFNAGDWRLYTSGSFYISDYKAGDYQDKTQEWDLWNTYVQRDIEPWKGTLQFGELNTSGDIFDTIPMRGVRISTNVQMLPYRDRAYSPVIEGVANTNAQIIIRQNNHVVYTLNVAPGPFRLDNLPNFGSYGDLEVVIREADGTERIMNVPNTYVANMLREGQYRYDFNVGRYYRKNATRIEEPMFMMGTLAYGLPYDVTLYGGSILSEGYYAFALGTGMSLGSFGAMNADVVQSNHRKDADRGIDSGHGAAWRIRYEKNLSSTGTRINLANYQYLTGNFATLQDYAEYGSTIQSFLQANSRVRNRWQLSMSQSLGSWGSLSFGGDWSKYHGDASDVKTLSAGYYTSIKRVGVGLTYSRSYQQVGYKENRHWDSSHSVMLNLNIPLDVIFGHSTNSLINSNSVTYMGRMNKDISGEKSYSQSVVMSGSNNSGWSWSLAQDLGDHEDRSTSVSASHSGALAHTNFGFDHNHYANTYSIGTTGAFVIHKTGVTMTPNAYDSLAIVEVPGASDVRVSQGFDSTTDIFGNAVVTYLSNYTKNDISIDPSTLPDGALLLDGTNRTVVPTQGAVVRVKFPVRFGKQAVFVMVDKHGNPLPFGSTVDLLDADGKKDPTVSGLVGEGGRVYLSGLPETGRLRVIQNEVVYSYNYEVPNQTVDLSGDFIPVPVIRLNP